MSETYDLAVIGAGPGGYIAALKAAEFDAQVALIEKSMFVWRYMSKSRLHSN